MNTGLQRVEAWPKQVVILITICFVTLVGLVDYATGYETFFFTFYLLPVFVGTWRVSAAFGALISALSVTAWVSANIEAGAHYSNYFIPVWNAAIMFAIYLIIVWLLARLQKIQAELEDRVRLRTAALTRENQERLRLQKELLETIDREQRRIGRELHDGLCQHLTGTALASQLLEQKLAAESPAGAAGAARLLQLIEQAIELTRNLSHELDPADLPSGRLQDQLASLAVSTREHYQVACRFVRGQDPGSEVDIAAATHLYRIALAAVTSAVKRSGVAQIEIELAFRDGDVVMSVTDDGIFLPEAMLKDAEARLRAMAYRADLIGALLNQKPMAARGSRLTCILPAQTTQDGKN